MDTIVRRNGHVDEFRTVVKTIKYLVDNKPGFYSIADIQDAINNQVHSHERFTRKMVRRAIIKIAEIQESLTKS